MKASKLMWMLKNNFENINNKKYYVFNSFKKDMAYIIF